MWFLRMDFILILVGVCVFMLICNRSFGGRTKRPGLFSILLLLLNIGILAYIHVQLAVFNGIYVLVTFLLIYLLKKIGESQKRHPDETEASGKKSALQKFFFCFNVILFIAPLVIARLFIKDGNPFVNVVIFTGLAYNMLKAVDCLFYTYYTGLPVPLLRYANFILFIPTFTSGPIFRYRDFDRFFERPEKTDAASNTAAIKRIILGLFKKVVLYEIMMQCFSHLLQMESRWYMSLCIVVSSYLIVFFDFSGYTDIAIGFGRLLGFKVPENFKHPFTSASFTQFWRNWHVTLSDWIREHIFILVMNKKLNKYQSGIIAFFTMVIMSLWHSFNIVYLVGGMYLGALLLFENIFSLTAASKKKTNRFVYVLRCVAVNLLFALNTIVFLLKKEEVIAVLKGFLKY